MKKILLGFAVLILLQSCFFMNSIIGSGNIITRDVTVSSSYTDINIGLAGDVVLTAAAPGSVISMLGDDNILDEVIVDVTNGKLNIEAAPFTNFINHTLVITVPVDVLQKISLSGYGDVSADFTLANPDLDIDLSGAGKMTFALNNGSVNANISGSGTITLSGTVVDSSFSISGNGDIFARNLAAVNADTAVSGAGDIEVQVSGIVNVRISGVGTVGYAGTGGIGVQIITGIGNVFKL